MRSGCNISANSRRLTDLGEIKSVKHILDLDSKGFPPQLSGVEDMANRLLATRDAGRVVVNWANTLSNGTQSSFKSEL